MALRSASAALDLIAPLGVGRLSFVTDSNYIVLGMTQWVRSWRARGWRRKGGPIENLDLWRELVERAEGRRIAWSWVRGHAGHPKNEYANVLATRAAAEQGSSGGSSPQPSPRGWSPSAPAAGTRGSTPTATSGERRAAARRGPLLDTDRASGLTCRAEEERPLS